MRTTAALTAVSLAAVAAAQNVTIQVGQVASAAGGALQFVPPSVKATNGSVITFQYAGAPGNHTVTQSTFASPCSPLSGGFDSGYVFVPAGTTDGFPTWNLTITNDQEPIWFFCAQHLPAPHCPAGMVGAINAPSTGNKTFEAFQSLAKSSTDSGTPVPALSGSGAFATAAPAPLTGSFSGLLNPTSGASAASSAASGASSSGSAASSGGAPAASNTNAAMGVSANGFFTFVAALLGVTLM
ncbi:hypothetical protein CERSUDRAFT_88657 [Gelatoporia subvermispora B]|uniref:Phytocyanin domain-containing protein n=1 Tax=Ceriporiopsis subvermispora (strain B) TaxID=914234 RepID=M2P8Q2_CERS8|nr:hypothetical protein CERSUDRAFT_88657 [Gelatoporia subvermispora B]